MGSQQTAEEIHSEYAARDAAIESIHAAFEAGKAALRARYPRRRIGDDPELEARAAYTAAFERLNAAYGAAMDACIEMQRAAVGRPSVAEEEAARDAEDARRGWLGE